jgi:hypothetical protein
MRVAVNAHARTARFIAKTARRMELAFNYASSMQKVLDQ